MTRKENLFNVSLKLFHERGFKGTTMRDIAKALDFEAANIYNYVSSKKSILETFLFEISKEFHDGIEDIVGSGYSPEDKLKAVVSLHVRLSVTKPYQTALLVNEWRNLSDLSMERYLSEKAFYESQVQEVIAEGIECQVFKAVDLEMATLLVLSSVRWLYDKFTCDEHGLNPIEMERQIAEFVEGGLRDA